MKAKPPSEEELAKPFDWWWRDPKYTASPAEIIAEWGTDRPYGHVWKGCLEVVAWHYELIRRFTRSSKLPGFWELQFSNRQYLCELWMPKDMRPWRLAQDQAEADDRKWTRPDAKLQWNLTLHPSLVVEAFERYLNGTRESYGLPKPRLNEGNRHRSVSWAWPELLDLSAKKARSLNDSERKSCSQARQRARGELEKLSTLPEPDKSFLSIWQLLRSLMVDGANSSSASP